MLDERSDAEEPRQPQSKLMLQAPPDQPRLFNDGTGHRHIGPEQLIRRQLSPASGDPLTRLVYYWRKDPAYKFFIVTVGTVLVASMVFAIYASNVLSSSLHRTAQQDAPPDIGTQATATGATDLRPTFATPGGGKGSNASSLPPKQGTVAAATGTAEPTQGDLQITGIPDQVNNRDTVPITVSGQPGTRVRLVISYNTFPYYTESTPNTIDDNGTTTLYWQVRVLGPSNNGNVTAQVMVRSDQGDQSQAVSVQVN